MFNVIHVINYLLIGENFPSCFTVAGTDWAMVVRTNLLLILGKITLSFMFHCDTTRLDHGGAY